jgi:hypothetical protein
MLARNSAEGSGRRSEILAQALDGPYVRRRLGLVGLARWLFFISDSDCHEFDRLERKRTRHEIERRQYF